jgi:hypothetical protein
MAPQNEKGKHQEDGCVSDFVCAVNGLTLTRRATTG